MQEQQKDNIEKGKQIVNCFGDVDLNDASVNQHIKLCSAMSICQVISVYIVLIINGKHSNYYSAL